MGNILLDDYKKDDPLQSFQKWLQQNPELTGKQILAQNKLFLSAHFLYCSKNIFLKVYFKRDNSSAAEIVKIFDFISGKINQLKCTNIIPLTILNVRQIMDKKQTNLIMATRQYLSTTLQNKLQSRPYLNFSQKKWIIFQMIMALEVVHTHMNVFHGNVRTSNFLTTTYQYLFLTDFANYKPIYILEDTQQGLAQFRLFYSSSLQKCNLAPEKLQGRNQSASKIKRPEYLFGLYKQSEADTRQSIRYSMAPSQRDTRSKRQLDAKSISYFSHINDLKDMDLFSLGLCILQVLNDGKNTFTYQNLLNLKKNKFSLEELIQNVVSSQQNTDNTQSFKKQLQQIKDIATQLLLKKSQNICPLADRFSNFMKDQVFVLLWHCLSSFTKISFQIADHRIYLFQSIVEFIEKEIKFSDYKFSMRKAKCLQNFAALKIFAQLIRKKSMFSVEVQPHTLLGQILASIQKKDNQSAVVESDDEVQLPKNKRQSFFINESKKKRISKRLSFVGNTVLRKQKILCPPMADQFLESLVEQQNSEIRLSKLSLQQRRKAKLQIYIEKIKSDQHIREQLKAQRSYFYSGYQLIIKIVFSCIRNCRYVASKMLGIQLMNILGRQSTDQTLLRVVMPYLIHLSQDSDINVAKYAFNSLLDNCYNFIDPFCVEEDIAYYYILLEFFLNTIKGSKIRIFMFGRFQEIYNICQWLEVVYLRIHSKFVSSGELSQSTSQKIRLSAGSPALINFYKLVDQLKINYGTFTPKQIQSLMQNIPISILPQMFEFYISFLNTQKIMGLKCSLFIAENAQKQFQMQKYIVDVFDNCMECGLMEVGIALCYSIKYFTIRKNTSLDIVQKIVPHVINPHRWAREQALQYLKMCLQQYPAAKIFFLLRDILDAPFPLTLENLTDPVLLPQPLREMDINLKERKFTNRISRKMGLTERKFIEYMKGLKLPKDTIYGRKQIIDQWELQTRKFRIYENLKQSGQSFGTMMKKTIQTLYENNFFYYGFLLAMKYNSAEHQQGLLSIFQNLKKFSKLNLETTSISQQQKQFFQNLFATINSNFQKLLTKHTQQINPEKLKLSLCINVIAQQLYMFHQMKVKPAVSITGGGIAKNNPNDRNFKPKGIQVSEIYENKQAISGLIKLTDYLFVSGSHDGTIRVYNTKAIQMNLVTQSQGVYQLKNDSSQQKIRINCLTCFQNSYTAVVGTNKGQIKGIQIERMPGKLDSSRVIKQQNQTQLFRYTIAGDIQKLTVPKSPQFSDCIAYITSESLLGVQDIRSKELSLKCNIGKQRGYCLSLATNENSSLLVGTVDGYLLTYDLRFNLVSSVLQLYKDNQPVPITNIIKVPSQTNKFCLTYPAMNFQFCQFSLDSAETRIQPSRLYTGFTPSNLKQEQHIPSIPYLENKTNDQVFRQCNNNIMKHVYYSDLSNFDISCKILDYVSEPLTLKQAKIREVWANGCRHRYNQILSIYNKKTVPFVEYFPSGILTNFNPNAQSLQSRNVNQFQPKNLSFLVDRRQSSSSSGRYDKSIASSLQESQNASSSYDIDRQVITRHNKIKISQFDQTQNKEHFTSSVVVNGMIAVANKSGRIKLFK